MITPPLGAISIDISKPVPQGRGHPHHRDQPLSQRLRAGPDRRATWSSSSAARKTRARFGINIYSDLSQIPDNVWIASVVFQLQYADSKDVKAIVDLYVSHSIYTSSVPLPGALIVTESTVMLPQHREDHRGGGRAAGGSREPLLPAPARQCQGRGGQAQQAL